MSAPKPELLRRVTALHVEGLSQHEIARQVGLSRSRVQQLLGHGDSTDRLHDILLARSSSAELRRHECVLVERIRRDRRHLRATRDELGCRDVDEVLGLTLSSRESGATMPPCEQRQRQPQREPVGSS